LDNRFSILGAAVNDLIHFQPAKRPHRSGADPSGAQILFFTGVRYERMSEEGCAPPPPASRAAQQEGEDGGRGDGSGRTRRR
jgi:hypothetical protein